MTTINVLPQREVLTDHGCVWESLLAMQGWNELPPDQKPGRVEAAYTDGTVDIYFPALNYTARGVFTDELFRA